jgi:hypothetical protein
MRQHSLAHLPGWPCVIDRQFQVTSAALGTLQPLYRQMHHTAERKALSHSWSRGVDPQGSTAGSKWAQPALCTVLGLERSGCHCICKTERCSSINTNHTQHEVMCKSIIKVTHNLQSVCQLAQKSPTTCRVFANLHTVTNNLQSVCQLAHSHQQPAEHLRTCKSAKADRRLISCWAPQNHVTCRFLCIHSCRSACSS